MQRRFTAFLSFPLTFVILCLACACSPHAASAQRDAPEYRTQTVSVFGGFLYNRIAYRPVSATGFVGGFDLTRHFLSVPLSASFEARANVSHGSLADERTYVFGPRVGYRFGRFEPYADFEVGLGNIHYEPAFELEQGYYGDKSTIAAGGGGVDIAVLKNLQARVDFQVQHWDIDPLTHDTFTPTLATFGVVYTLPFRPFIKQGDPHYK